jgi:hypothetical protein
MVNSLSYAATAIRSILSQPIRGLRGKVLTEVRTPELVHPSDLVFRLFLFVLTALGIYFSHELYRRSWDWDVLKRLERF